MAVNLFLINASKCDYYWELGEIHLVRKWEVDVLRLCYGKRCGIAKQSNTDLTLNIIYVFFRCLHTLCYCLLLWLVCPWHNEVVQTWVITLYRIWLEKRFQVSYNSGKNIVFWECTTMFLKKYHIASFSCLWNSLNNQWLVIIPHMVSIWYTVLIFTILLIYKCRYLSVFSFMFNRLWQLCYWLRNWSYWSSILQVSIFISLYIV